MPSNRKEFLRLVATVAVLRPATQAAPQQPQLSAPVVDQEPFPLRVLEHCGAAMRCALCYIGDRVGIFQSMAASGPLTVTDLAKRTKLNERLLREWLNSMATARYIEYRPADKTYLLNKEHAEVLANEEFSAISGMFQLVSAVVSAAPKMAEALQTGRPVNWSEYGADLNAGTHRATLPDFKHELAQKWIPLMPHVDKIVTAGGHQCRCRLRNRPCFHHAGQGFSQIAVLWVRSLRASNSKRARAREEGESGRPRSLRCGRCGQATARTL